ncbi:PREDICTED: methyltransferase-like protein 7A [Branchiostoma belcheri]|uniref:Methyltransferase-like protein 7A n=1 Tax=Branchiostoma belcheri TaxID=7741 RepID=A0A6P5A2K6_BRABE|nr:PREDICTED: methyltransferase-like protein 7A [Branchiostoma belcheri]
MAVVWWILAFVLILVAALSTQPGKAVFRLIYRKVYAYILSRIAKSYNKKMSPFKEKLFEDMKTHHTGDLTVLEIGVGAGANFKFYPAGTSVIAVDPNPEFDKYLMKNAEEFGEVKLQDFVIAAGEEMAGVPDCSVDVAVCTLVMCSVADQVKVLAEIKRVLKPGGKFYYMEHVRAAPDTWAYSIQNWVDVVWPYLSDGCTVRSELWKHLDTAGFSQVDYQKFDAPIRMALIAPHLMGTATK